MAKQTKTNKTTETPKSREVGATTERVFREIRKNNGKAIIMEVAQAVGLQSVSARYHVKWLTDMGFIKETGEHRQSGVAGRPPMQYEVTSKGCEEYKLALPGAKAKKSKKAEKAEKAPEAAPEAAAA